LTVVNVLSHRGLIEEFLDILHSISAIIRGKRARLTDRINVAHVSDGWSYEFVMIFNKIVYLFVGGIGSRNEIVLIEIRIVRSSYD